MVRSFFVLVIAQLFTPNSQSLEILTDMLQAPSSNKMETCEKFSNACKDSCRKNHPEPTRTRIRKNRRITGTCCCRISGSWSSDTSRRQKSLSYSDFRSRPDPEKPDSNFLRIFRQTVRLPTECWATASAWQPFRFSRLFSSWNCDISRLGQIKTGWNARPKYFAAQQIWWLTFFLSIRAY